MSLSQSGAKPDLNVMTEEEQLNYALQMSMHQAASDADMKDDDEDLSRAMNDPDFLQRVISELPGVDPNSEAVRSAVDALNKDKTKDADKDNK